MPFHQMPPVFRFAPSPNGLLHLGHAYSVLLNEKMARNAGGRLLLRIEDVDRQRSRKNYETALVEDLDWLNIAFDEAPQRQSDHLEAFETALTQLISDGFAYPSSISRSQINLLAAKNPKWPRDPDGAFLSPLAERTRRDWGPPCAIRLNMEAALAACPGASKWQEAGEEVSYEALKWGDIVLKSRDGSYAYHLAAVVDDAAQNITDIIRGRDLFAATAIHRVLQNLLGFPAPNYFHHDLILDETGEKLAKSRKSPSLQDLRRNGMTAQDLRAKLGFSA